MSGFATFANALPEPLLRAVDPAGVVDERDLRRAIAMAIATFLISFAVRTALAVLGGTFSVLAGRRHSEPGSGIFGLLRVATGFAAIALPWVVLVGIYLDGTYAPGLYVLAGGCLAVWWLTRSLQSARLWVDVRRVELVRRSGLAIGRIRTVRVPLAEAFEANHVPVHAGADRRRTPPVAPTTTAWRLARDHLGSEPDARTWLRAAARTLGFTPAAHFGRNEAT